MAEQKSGAELFEEGMRKQGLERIPVGPGPLDPEVYEVGVSIIYGVALSADKVNTKIINDAVQHLDLTVRVSTGVSPSNKEVAYIGLPVEFQTPFSVGGYSIRCDLKSLDEVRSSTDKLLEDLASVGITDKAVRRSVAENLDLYVIQ